VRHLVTFADIGAGGKTATAGDFLEEKNGLDGFSGIRQSLR